MKKQKTTSINFSQRLEEFLNVYAPGSIGASPNTLASYCSAFRQYFSFRSEKDGIDPDELCISDFTMESIESFLNWIETECGCKTVTRNQRLAAIHAFTKYLIRKEPQYMGQFQQIMTIRVKKYPEKKVVDYLTSDETTAILKAIDSRSNLGRRDTVMFSLLYDTGARVQEIADLSIGDIKLYSRDSSWIYLTGKGSKTRSVPISTASYDLLKIYLNEIDCKNGSNPVFFNRDGNRLTRHGITHKLKKYVAIASEDCPSLKSKTVTPHTLRHSKAIHLLQSGVDLMKIRDLLGHESVSTTEIYARTQDTDLRLSMHNASSEMPEIASWHKNPGIMEKLAVIAKNKK